jgi:hypothetical protein
VAKIEWRHTWASNKPRIKGKQFMPKRPVIWWGSVWMEYPDGTRDTREWRTCTPILRKEAQRTLKAMFNDLLKENGNNAVNAGFVMECA